MNGETHAEKANQPRLKTREEIDAEVRRQNARLRQLTTEPKADGPGALYDSVSIPTNPKTTQGLKKPPLDKIPGVALVHMSIPMGDGAVKYGPRNWRDDPVEASIYVAAAMRHLAQFMDGEFWDPESKSGASHLGAAMASIAVLIDAMYQGTWLDDRGTSGNVAGMIRVYSDTGSLPEPLRPYDKIRPPEDF